MKFLVKLVAAAALLLAGFGFAQTAQAQQGLIVGAKLGANLATVGGDDASDDNSLRPGLLAGGYGRYNFTDMFGVQLEVLYSGQGANNSEVDDAYTSLNYLNFPLTFNMTFATDGALRPRVFAGPYLGMLLSAENGIGDDSEDVSDFFKSTDFGLTVGAGVDFGLDPLIISFDARYSPSLTTIAEEVDLGPFGSEEADIRNSVISLTVGAAILIGN